MSPYSNLDKSLWDKMDSCVTKVMGQGHDKSSAIAICHKSLMGSEPMPDPNLKETRALYFAEQVSLLESELDAGEYVARNVTLIKPGFSTNADKAGRPRYYAPEVLKQAAPVFEGTRAYRNHPRRSDQKDMPERDVRDQVGYYENVQAAQDGTLKGDLRVVGEARAWLWPMIEETKRKPNYVALSINALGQTRLGEAEGRKAVIIESIVGANSVDVVTTGAAGGTFAGALLQSDPDGFTGDLIRAMPFEQWREARADYVDRLKAEWKTVRETEAIKTVQSKLDEANQTITRLQETDRASQSELAHYHREAQADRLLTASALPHPLRPEVRAQLVEQLDEAGMQKVLEREEAKYRALPKPPVAVNGAGQRPAAQPTEGKPEPNKSALLFGLNEAAMPQPGETAEEYKARRRQTD